METPTSPRVGGMFSPKSKVEQLQHTQKSIMAHRPVHNPVPRYARIGYPGRPLALGWGGRQQGESEQRQRKNSPAAQISAFYPNPGPATRGEFGRSPATTGNAS